MNKTTKSEFVMKSFVLPTPPKFDNRIVSIRTSFHFFANNLKVNQIVGLSTEVLDIN